MKIHGTGVFLINFCIEQFLDGSAIDEAACERYVVRSLLKACQVHVNITELFVLQIVQTIVNGHGNQKRLIIDFLPSVLSISGPRPEQAP